MRWRLALRPGGLPGTVNAAGEMHPIQEYMLRSRRHMPSRPVRNNRERLKPRV